MGEYLMARFRGTVRERVLLVCLDRQRRITCTSWLGSGTADMVELPIREAIAQAVRLKAHWVVLCHNHPSGSALPSREDIEATAELARGMYVVGVELLDHIIVTETEYLSLRQRSELPEAGNERLRIFQLRED